MAWLIALTQFGDLAVLLPLTAVMLSWLLVIRFSGGAAWWTFAVVFCAGSTAVLKIFFYGCPLASDLHTPSGHSSFATLVYGAITLVSATETARVRRVMTIGAGAGFILAIAVSRLLLSVHSALEVGVGLVIGSAALALFGQGYLRLRAAQVWPPPLLIASAVVVFVLYGRELHAEELLRGISGYLQIRCS
jgi:membrane-associated phospholipid phosphatase